MLKRGKTNPIIQQKVIVSSSNYQRNQSSIIEEHRKNKGVNLLHKRVEDYQLISYPQPTNLSTYQHYNSSIINKEQNVSWRKDSSSSNANTNKPPIMTNNYITSNNKAYPMRQSPFRVLENNINSSASSSYGYGGKQNASTMNNSIRNSIEKSNIFAHKIPDPEWLLKNRKKKEVNRIDNEKKQRIDKNLLMIKIQKIWRGYRSRKKLFNELRVFFQSNQFVYIIENVERKNDIRKCLKLLQYKANTDINEYDNMDPIYKKPPPTTSTKSKTPIQVVQSKDETLEYKAKLSQVLLKRILNIKEKSVNNIIRLCFKIFHNNTIEDKDSNIPSCIITDAPIIQSNPDKAIESIETKTDNTKKKSINKVITTKSINLKRTEQEQQEINPLSILKSKGSSTLPPNATTTTKAIPNPVDHSIETDGGEMLLSIKKGLKLSSILATYKNNLLHQCLLRWKENIHEYSKDEIRQFITLYYIKVLTKSMSTYYSRRLDSYMRLWLKKAFQIRKKIVKARYTGMVILHQFINIKYQKTYIDTIITAFLSKQLQSE